MQESRTVTFVYEQDEPAIITHQYWTEDDSSIQPDTTHTALIAQEYTATRLTIAGYTYLGYRIDGGELRSSTTAIINNVQQAHTITFVYVEDGGGVDIQTFQIAVQLQPGQIQQLGYIVTPSNAIVTAEWSSSDTDVVSVSQDGVLTAHMDGHATITVTEAWSNITRSMHVIVGDGGPVTGIDTSALQSLINRIDQLDKNDYISSTWSDLETASESARALLARPDKTQDQVNSMVAQLQAAFDNLIPRGNIDTSQLEALFDQIDQLNEIQYTPQSWSALQLILRSAHILLEDPDVTQSQVDVKCAQLQAAIDDLVAASAGDRNFINNNNAQITYQGNWTYAYSGDFYMGDQSISNTPGDYAEIQFTGTGIKWVGAKQHNLGMAKVYLDGTEVESGIDLYDTGTQTQLILYGVNGLSNGAHTLRIEVAADKNAASSDLYVTIDAFEIEGGSATPPPTTATKINDNDPQISYQGNWITANSSDFYMGDQTISNTAGDYAEIQFTGTGIKFFGAKQYNLGIAKIYLDGTDVGSDIDLYDPGTQTQLVLYSVSDLPLGSHTLRIEVTGDQNASAADCYVTIDAFELIADNIPEPAAPANISSTYNLSTDTYTITGLSTSLEYNTSTNSTWTPCSATTMQVPNPSSARVSYNFRYPAQGSTPASKITTITLQRVSETISDVTYNSRNINSQLGSGLYYIDYAKSIDMQRQGRPAEETFDACATQRWPSNLPTKSIDGEVYVSGKLTKGGQPVANRSLRLHIPLTMGYEINTTATTDSSGSFRFSQADIYKHIYPYNATSKNMGDITGLETPCALSSIM